MGAEEASDHTRCAQKVKSGAGMPGRAPSRPTGSSSATLIRNMTRLGLGVVVGVRDLVWEHVGAPVTLGLGLGSGVGF